MKNRIREFIDFWLTMIDGDKRDVFEKLVGAGHMEVRPIQRVQPPRIATRQALTIVYLTEEPLGEPLIIGRE